MKDNWKQWVRPHILDLKAYSSARDEFEGTKGQVFLDANESPFDNGVNRYPDPYQRKLKSKIAEIKNANERQLLLGNGSDEILDLVFRTFLEPQKDELWFLGPSYGMYQVLAELNQVKYSDVPLNTSFDVDLEDLKAIEKRPKLMIVCNPNNPSGTIIEPRKLKDWMKAWPEVLFLIDEAYIDFCLEYSMLPKLNDLPNLLITQTFSKAWGAAGIRLGMLWGDEKLIQIINKVKPPYNVNSLTQEKALTFLEDYAQIERQKKKIIQERSRVFEELKAFSFVEEVVPSVSNFILFFTPLASEVYQFATERNVILRNRSSQFQNRGAIRMTIGTKEENSKVLEILKDYEKSIVYR